MACDYADAMAKFHYRPQDSTLALPVEPLVPNVNLPPYAAGGTQILEAANHTDFLPKVPGRQQRNQQWWPGRTPRAMCLVINSPKCVAGACSPQITQTVQEYTGKTWGTDS